ncbi:DUF4226 domain-containing protein [Mycolicibacter arupensis]|uniref:DUF4226 domain-containing protein n=1 Tax=Mycolicibacter arupensis TaxID=342002 RepID=UPI003B3BA2B9
MPDQVGTFAEAARVREEQLRQRLATTVELDRSVEGMLRGAHQHNLQSRARLDALESEIRAAAASWPARNTPAGARQFQVYLAGKTREIHKIVADAAADSQQRAAQVQALTGRYPAGGGTQDGQKNSPPPTPSPTREPPAYDPADVADLLKKIDDWKQENNSVANKVRAFNKKWPDGIAFDMEDPAQAARYQEWKREHDAVQSARNQVVSGYGEIVVEAGRFGGQVDDGTGDIVWPDGSRTSLRPRE